MGRSPARTAKPPKPNTPLGWPPYKDFIRASPFAPFPLNPSSALRSLPPVRDRVPAPLPRGRGTRRERQEELHKAPLSPFLLPCTPSRAAQPMVGLRRH